jgi:HEAT repeat protein
LTSPPGRGRNASEAHMGSAKGKKIVFAGLTLALAVLGVTAYLFRDRAVEEWYLWKLDSGNPTEARWAAERLAYRGSARAIPLLLKSPRWFGAGLHQRCFETGERRATAQLKEFLKHPPKAEELGPYFWCLETLNSIEPRSPEAIVAASRVLERRDLGIQQCEIALDILEGGGESGTMQLTRLLDIEDPGIRRFALFRLAEIGPDASPAVPALIELLAQEPYFEDAALALVEIGSQTELLARLLVPRIASDDPSTRQSASKIIERMGREAKATIPISTSKIAPSMTSEPSGQEALRKRIEDLRSSGTENNSLTLDEEMTLNSISMGSIPMMKSSLASPNPTVALVAALSLMDMKEIGDDRILPVLIKALEGERDSLWHEAVSTLGSLGPAARDAVPTLIEEIDRSQRKRVAGDAHLLMAVLGAIGPAKKDALGGLIGGLSDPWRTVPCCFSLLEMGEEAREAIPELEKLLRDDQHPYPEWVAAALIALEPSRATKLLPIIGNELRKEFSPDLVYNIAMALGELHELAKPLVPKLIDSALAGNWEAARALEKIRLAEPQVASLAAELRKAPAGGSRRQRMAIEVLLSIEPAPDATLQGLTEVLESPDAEVRLLAAQALGRLGPEARGAIPALTSLIRDHKRAVRAAARDALARIQADR